MVAGGRRLKSAVFDIALLLDATRGQKGRGYLDAQRDFLAAVCPIVNKHGGTMNQHAVHGTCGEIFQAWLTDESVEAIKKELATNESLKGRVGFDCG